MSFPLTFHREKYVSAGGPDGGDGGNGGNIVLVVDDNMSTLMDFRYKRKYVADNGMDGQGARKFGKQGKDLTIRVPRGTVVRDAESNEIIKDMSDSEPFILCRGGKGGWGNAHFATPTRQAPRHHRGRSRGRGPWSRLPAPYRPLPPARSCRRRVGQRGPRPGRGL